MSKASACLRRERLDHWQLKLQTPRRLIPRVFSEDVLCAKAGACYILPHMASLLYDSSDDQLLFSVIL